MSKIKPQMDAIMQEIKRIQASLEKMANANVEGFSDQGYSWFQNLIEADPYLGLHAISAAAIIAIVRIGGETGQATMAKGMKNAMTILPIASIFITKNFAAAIMVYFAVNSILSLIQSTLFRSNWFRKLAGMPPKLSLEELKGWEVISRSRTW
ncbi:Mitochondrial inner membrane protein OXA1 [Candida viswanathii]|uniref:Mitochondrial inner membrane protein OXA1 n=1 Tax=Candida viswanathii TaxID=5486 RepID=A0A367YI77_9ASCO|nr:Mitochondrial inner membrane protein OXA1 [Candida viswanathii]